MVRLLVLLAFALWPAVVRATTLAPITLEALFANADHVAVVEVIDSTPVVVTTPVVGTDRSCGAISHGRVIDSLKGTHGEMLEFGYDESYRPGERYLLFR